MHVKLALELENAQGPSDDAHTQQSLPYMHLHGSLSSSSSSSAGATPTSASASKPSLDIQSLAGIFSRLGYAPKLKTSSLKVAQRRGPTHQYLTVNLPGAALYIRPV